MSLQLLYILVATLILVADFVITFFLGRKAADIISYKIIRRFSLLVLTQILFLLWENFFCEIKLIFPLWMLMFLFYGPYIYLFVCYNVNRQYQDVFRVYLLDFYFTICAFSFAVFVLLFQHILFTDFANYLQYILGLGVLLSLCFYWYRSYALLQQHKFDFNCKVLLSYKTKSLQLINVLFVFIAIVLSFLMIDYTMELSIVYFCLLVLLVFHIYLSSCKYDIIKGTYLSVVLNNDKSKDTENVLPATRDEIEKGELITKSTSTESADYIQVDPTELKYEKVQLSDAVIQKLDIKVTAIIIQKKAYLDPDFKMFDLARQTKVSRYYLAQYFRSVHNMNFREYINKLRIIHILEFIKNYNIKSQERLTINQLFTESSFNSKTSFFKSFKDVTGCTPAEFIRKQI
ncbi:helix-turn-helix domain-containing protein [Flavobacterium sp. HSC-61S13]|uniref:helix-turn-helix domain-containing protein n=1 Tax=Flavobacterium sp. HSC-61S13 TaxID=2910963 RepID=UPI0020A02923|nr:helix-turn-helix domain-containing protein [Flavobacterium sp. HSC-61S13]MCP1996486.1 AraC-like DNA-binding protein [Flavobacterium sp. HSC-61S13]